MVGLKLFFRLCRQLHLWWQGRSFHRLLLGLPALGVGIAAGVVTVLSLSTPEAELETRYLEQARNAFQAKDYAGALTYYERLAPRGGERPAVLYGLALTADALGQSERASLLMAELAPADGQGYGPAHLWRAGQLLRSPRLSALDRQAAESHLLHALDGEPEDREAAHALLGELYLAGGQLDQAEPHLLKAVKAKPHLRLRLAVLYALKGNKERARSEAQLAVTFYRARSQVEVGNHQARIRWADATTFLEDFPAAVAILEEGLTATHEPLYRQALAAVYLLWSDALARDSRDKVGDRLSLLERGLRYDPANAGLLDRLSAATRIDGPDADKARAALQGLLARGEAPATVHFALGVDAWQRGKTDEARLHWECAHQLAPQVGVIANNLALALAQGKVPDLPRALELVNLALEHSPHEANFRDTRGTILVRMGRWKEALPDLEAALPRQSNKAELHRTLAEVYEHLGAPEMAAEHKRLAEAKPAEPMSPPGAVH
jgi:tetratricopeptide (TPR) repeat protein